MIHMRANEHPDFCVCCALPWPCDYVRGFDAALIEAASAWDKFGHADVGFGDYLRRRAESVSK